MAGDIVSRIRLEATGGDQVAQELQKIKDESENVSRALGDIEGASIGGASPFDRAFAAGADTTMAQRSDMALSSSRARLDAMTERSRTEAHQSNITGREISGPLGTATTAAQQASRGDGLSSFGTAAGAVGAMFGPMGMLIGGGLAAGAMGASSLANTEVERVQQMYASGLGQGLGRADYGSFRDDTILLQRSGIDPLQYFQALRGSGGRFGENAWDRTRASMMHEMSLGTGMDVSVMAQLTGTMQQLDVDTQGLREEMSAVRMGAGRFGVSGLDPFMGAIAQSMAGAAGRGVGRGVLGRDRIESDAAFMAALGGASGMSIQGATGIFQQAQQRGAAASDLSRPEDMVALQAIMSQEGVSLTEAMMIMEQDPLRAFDDVVRHIQGTSGNEEVARLRTRQFMGGTMSQADAVLSGQEFRDAGGTPTMAATEDILTQTPFSDELIAVLRSMGISIDPTTARRGVPEGRTTLQRENRQVLENLERSLERFRNRVSESMFGGRLGTGSSWDYLFNNPDGLLDTRENVEARLDAAINDASGSGLHGADENLELFRETALAAFDIEEALQLLRGAHGFDISADPYAPADIAFDLNRSGAAAVLGRDVDSMKTLDDMLITLNEILRALEREATD